MTMDSDSNGDSLYIGSHLSTAGGWKALIRRSHDEGGTAFAFFPRSPYGKRSKALDPAGAGEFGRALKAEGYGPLVVHAPYVYNLAGKDPAKREFAIHALVEDMTLLGAIRAAGQETYLNIHPGAHVGQGAEAGCRLIAEGLDRVFEMLADGENGADGTDGTDAAAGVMILLETMAGKGTEVGRTFEELSAIIARVAHPELLGVCLDTCHVSDAGYDIAADLDGVLAEFDRVLGLGRLRALHLNDSKNPVGAHKDRHERLGNGHLGLACFARIVRDERLRHLPMILETPNELDGYEAEIACLRELAEGADVDEALAELRERRDGEQG